MKIADSEKNYQIRIDVAEKNEISKHFFFWFVKNLLGKYLLSSVELGRFKISSHVVSKYVLPIFLYAKFIRVEFARRKNNNRFWKTINARFFFSLCYAPR